MKACGLSLVLLVGAAFSGCGTSVFSPVSSNDSREAVTRDAINALNKDDFAGASAKLETLWSAEKTNDIAQLYAVSLLGQAGFDVFGIVKSTVSGIGGDSSASGEEKKGDDILNQLQDIIKVELTEANVLFLRRALSVLDEAPDQTDAGVIFQRCLTGGIYAAPTLNQTTATVATLQSTLASLPEKLQYAAGGSCQASNATVTQVSADLNAALNDAGSLAGRIADVSSIISRCFSTDQQSQSDSLIKQIDGIFETADKGCALPGNGQIGSIPFPTCLNTLIEEAGASVAAGDKQLAGCEIFIHCSDGGCFGN